MGVRLALLLTAILLLFGCEQQEPPKPVAPRLVIAMRVADASGLMERTFPGRAKAAQEVNRSFRVSGPLISFPVKVGDKVKRGDVLARIDPQDYETAVRTIEGQLDREAARAKRAAADLTRLENIYQQDPGATSEAAIDRAAQTRDSARAGLRSLQASVTATKDQLAYTYLKAPFDGVVAETYVENFETVVAKQPILRLIDASSIEFVISVPESLISLAPYVETINVAFDVFPGVEVAATIAEIGNEASQATRTYPVTLAMEQPEGQEILPGMAGEASVISRPPDDTQLVGIVIPATAVFSAGDKSKNFVWIIDETTKTISRRDVEVGKLARFGVNITSGLKAGDWMVVKGVHTLDEGETVRIRDTSKDEAP